MRKSKFRAYRSKYGDDDTPVMTKPFTLVNLQDREDFSFTNGMSASCDEFGLDWEDCVVMQSTGTHDKNGIEIYEGDIVNDGTTIGTVKLQHGVFGAWSHPFFTYFIHMDFSKLEVVGNVYENCNKDTLKPSM